MYKEFIVLVCILIVVIVLDIITQNYTKEIINQINNDLLQLKNTIKDNKENLETISKDINEIYDNLMKFHDKLALYIDHIELEKVENNLVSAKSYIETNDFNQAITELDKTVFTLHHIGQKYAFNLANIF